MADITQIQECRAGRHPYEKVVVIEQTGARGDAAVRHCPICGALSIDLERRGRIVQAGGILRERIPETLRRIIIATQAPK